MPARSICTTPVAAVLALFAGSLAQVAEGLPECGTTYHGPMGSPEGSRPCAPLTRTYQPRYRAIGHDILDIDDAACPVPDSEYKLLDDVIDDAIARVKALPAQPPSSSASSASAQGGARVATTPAPDSTASGATREHVLAVSGAIRDAMVHAGFALYVPVKNLSDALYPNGHHTPAQYLADCDTASFIYLSVAEALGLHAQLVDIKLASDAGHNYVRWSVGDEKYVDWDTNGQNECVTPKQAKYLGVGMTRDQALGYAHFLSALTWKEKGEFSKALAAYREAQRLYDINPVSSNNLAWLVATHRSLAEQAGLREEALAAAQRTVKIDRTANYLDTQACVYAMADRLPDAIQTELEATQLAPDKQEFAARLAQFRQGGATANCFGAE